MKNIKNNSFSRGRIEDQKLLEMLLRLKSDSAKRGEGRTAAPYADLIEALKDRIATYDYSFYDKEVVTPVTSDTRAPDTRHRGRYASEEEYRQMWADAFRAWDRVVESLYASTVR